MIIETKIICLCGHEMKLISEIHQRATFECFQCKTSFWIPVKRKEEPIKKHHRVFYQKGSRRCKIFKIFKTPEFYRGGNTVEKLQKVKPTIFVPELIEKLKNLLEEQK